jgi:WD40 repeat protein
LEESYDGALLDLDVQSIDGRSISLQNTNKASIISAWRDHTVLVHAGREQWRLVHSLNHHRLGVNYARFYDTQKFITSSLDRTVVIGQLADEPEIVRTIHLARTHAVDIELHSDTTLVISTSDRQVLMYDIASGDLLHTYKSGDSSEMITLGNIGLSKSLTFPPLMKTRTMGSPVPQGQIRLRSLLAGAGNDKVPHSHLLTTVNPCL